MANVRNIVTNLNGNVIINSESDNGARLQVTGSGTISGDWSASGYVFANGESLGASIRVGGIYGDLGLYVPSTYDMQFDLGWDGSFKFTRANVDRFRIDSSGVLYNNSGYLAYGDGTFTYLYAPDANGGITMGDATAPVNVYYNDTHTFQSAGQLANYGGFTSTGFGVGTVAPSSKLEVVKQGNAAGGTMLLSGSKTNNATKYGIIATSQYASDTETEGVGLIGGVNTSGENIVVVGGGIDEINTATIIRFFTAANTTTRGSANERMRINGSGNVLIGATTDNGFKLNVTGTQYISGNVSIGTTYNGFALNVAGVTYVIGASVWVQDGYGYVNSGATSTGLYPKSDNTIEFRNNNATNVLIDALGNVGIKATPSAWASGYSVLNVGAAAAISWTGAGANDFSLSTNAYYDASDSRWEYRGTGDGSARYSMTALSFEHQWYNAPIGTANGAISYTQAMTLKGNGNLLIGTTTDAGFKLDVNGNTRIQGNSYVTSRNYISIDGNLPVAYKIPYSQLAGGTVVSDNLANGGSAKAIYSSSTPGTFFFGPYSSIEPGSYVAKFRLKVASNASSSSIGSIDVAGTNIASNSLLLRPSMFPTSGDYYYFSVPFTVGPAASGSLETRWLNWPAGITDAYVDHVFIESAQSEAEVYVPTSKDFNVYTDGTSKLVVKNNGNVGLGNASPAVKLDMGEDSSTTNVGGIRLRGYDVYEGNIYKTATYGIYLDTDTNLRPIRIDGSAFITGVTGNVLIGTTTDAGYKLDVNGTGRISGVLTVSRSAMTTQSSYDYRNIVVNSGFGGGYTGQIQSLLAGFDGSLYGTDIGYTYNGAGYDLTFSTNDDLSGNPIERMRIKSSGNVGIGTTTPDSLTHIVGNTAGDGGTFNGSGSILHLKQNTGWSGNQPWALFVEGYSYLNGFRINAADGIRALYKTAAGGQLGFATAGNDPITFAQNNGDYRLYIASGGNVGIATTAPQQLLHVLGATNGYMMVQGANDAGQAGIYFKKEDTTGTMDRTKGLILFHTNVGSGFGRGHLGFCLNSADSNATVSVSDEKFRMVDNGDFLADGDVVAYSTTISDERYKTNITPIESALDKVNQMRGVSFDWTAVRSGREFGVIAQEIEKIAPEVVSEKELLNGETMKTVSYTSLVPFLIESIKELTQQVNELKAQLDGLTK